MSDSARDPNGTEIPETLSKSPGSIRLLHDVREVLEAKKGEDVVALAVEIMETRRQAFEEAHALKKRLAELETVKKHNEAIIAALRNDNFAAAEAFAEEFEKIGARLEGLADVTLDLVGGIVDEIALQEAEAG